MDESASTTGTAGDGKSGDGKALERPVTLTITVDGKSWTLGRIGFGVRVDAEEEVRKLRRIEFKAVMESMASLSESDKQTATLAAFDHLLRNITVSTKEAGDWLGTPSGELHQLWKSLQKATPDATLAQARELLAGLTTEQYAQVQDFWAATIGSHRVVPLSNENYELLKTVLKLEE